MAPNDMDKLIAQVAEKYPPLLTPEQAAEIASVPLKTIYAWSSAAGGGRLEGCKVKLGRHVRFGRDCFIRALPNALN